MTDELPQSDSLKSGFLPEVLDRTVIAIPLLLKMNEERARLRRAQELRNKQQQRGKLPRREAAELKTLDARPPEIYPVIIDLNLLYHGRPPAPGAEDAPGLPGGRKGARQRIEREFSQTERERFSP